MRVELEPRERTSEVCSAADVLLRQLSVCGVDYFFANGGTDFPPIAEAFARAEATGEAAPRPLVIPHENLAVAMAHGVYMVSGRAQAVMVHVNVGTANAVNAVLDASRDETPVLLFAGRSPYSEAGRHGSRTRYIHWAQEMFDQAGMLREAVKWDYELHLPEQAGEIVARAHQVAMSAPRGPVYVTLPRDTLAGAAALPGSSATAPLALVPAPHPDPASIAQLADWLALARQPVIVTASAGRSEAGFRALARFAERFAVPVVSFHQRFLNIASDHPCFAGFEPGPWIHDADLVIALDCDVPWIPSIQNPPKGARVAHLGIDPAYTRYPMRSFQADLCLPGEAAVLLGGLERALEGRIAEHCLSERRAEIRRRRPSLTLPEARDPITPEWISACVAKAVGPEAIIVNEYPLRLDHCPRRQAGTYFGLSPAGGLGWGLGAALGAKLAAPDRLVVATLGDGAYIFANPTASHWAAATHGLPVLTVVFNNALYGAVRNSTLAMYREGFAAKNRGRMLADLGPAPDFERVVEASGGLGLRVESANALPGALAEAVAAVRGGRQALVNVICEY
ncbi:thiamine pyrophosphate-requiring protein [Methylobacterium sp. R2-1]|uniref:thiamine pyrophosphate-requiring protein n=1 Tax=Methylobacterium sp. R2-1 TaxID=2587064 RepID=UPI00161C7CB5|nr:thiamine pyrophosphate-requiring protein [Methylobacterium sp. R2-1]MBB2963331.1 acetolactate synthase-1/2/3 large subunit [Methylobacterium sp. R2-1]